VCGVLLKTIGAGILRMAFYVLPTTASAEQALLKVAKDVVGVTGSAHIMELACRSKTNLKQIMRSSIENMTTHN
jgi:hypothetical protein